MDMAARKQYLITLQDKYFKADSKKIKSAILDEYIKNTHMNRKYIIRKMNSELSVEPAVRMRRSFYDSQIISPLAKVWAIFDYPCGQRLSSILKIEIDRLVKLGEIHASIDIIKKLKTISSSTIDRKLRHEKEVLKINLKHGRVKNHLIYQKIPVKSHEWDNTLLGQIEIDYVEHCGSSVAGEYIHTVSSVDISSGWWEGEAILGKSQAKTFIALDKMRSRSPGFWKEMHPDNDTCFINEHLLKYANSHHMKLSRSRPYKKNDNCFIEQKNSTHVRAIFGHLRYDSSKELSIINNLYSNQLRLYKNFFQPVMKLSEKTRVKGKVIRRYSIAKTPFQRIIESNQISEIRKESLRRLYNKLNPALLKRQIDEQLKLLYKAYQEKDKKVSLDYIKKQTKRIDSYGYILNNSTTHAMVT